MSDTAQSPLLAEVSCGTEAWRKSSGRALHTPSAWTSVMALFACVSCSDDDGSGMVTVQLTNAPGAIVAYRDGSAAWTATTGARGDVRFAAPSGAYSVAIACDVEGDRQVRAYELTTAELSTIEYEVECGAERQMISGAFVNSTVFGAAVFWGPQSFGGGENSYAFSAPRGTGDLVAKDPYNGAERVMVKRGLTLGDAPLIVDIDFNDPAILAVATHEIVTAAVTTDELSVTSSLLTSGGTYTSLPLCQSTLPITCGVSSGLAPADLHVVWIVASNRRDGFVQYRGARWTTREVVDRSIDFPTALSSSATVTAANQDGRLSVAAQWPTGPRAPLYRVIASQDVQPSASTTWELFVSEGRLSDGLDVTLPDLAGVAGWDTAFDLVSAQYVNWWVEARDGTTLDEMMRRFPTHESLILSDGWMGAAAASP
jgi:hypothetical protein